MSLSAVYVHRMTANAIVVLNGPSSAGKSTLAAAIRDRIGPNATAVSLDRFFPMVSPSHVNDWNLFATLSEAMLATAIAFADRGFLTIVDTVFERTESLQRLREVFGHRRYHLVAVTCPVDVLETREQARGNRRLGQAREQHQRVLQGAVYDLYLDTHALELEACVMQVLGLLASRAEITDARRDQ
jgi:chloramphenicol 3-O phosphotransferase